MENTKITREQAEALLMEFETYSKQLFLSKVPVPSPKVQWFLDQKFENS